MANPYTYWNRQLEMQTAHILSPYEPSSNRKNSVTFQPPMSSESPSSPIERRSSAVSSRTSSISSVRTRSLGYGAGVAFERILPPPMDDDLIIVTVKLSHRRRWSADGGNKLPDRPPARGFLRRMSTRLSGSGDDECVRAVKMKRRDYKRFFARDTNGEYIGSEPEQEWGDQDLAREFGMYQDQPLRSSLC